MINFPRKITGLALTIAVLLLNACGASYEKPGVEYAPDMYHSVAYEPLKQVRDTTAGRWRSKRSDTQGDFENYNDYNPNGLSMRLPVKGTVARRNYKTAFGGGDTAVNDLMIYNIPKDSIEVAERTLVNPLPATPAILDEGKVLYANFCQHCHGAEGKGNGLVAAQYKGVSSYSSAAVRNANGGHIFHVITHGKGRMWPHGSQMNPEERWKIVHYVHTLQKLP